MRTVKVTYCGIPLSAVPPEYLRRNPGKRVNYFEVPWCASCPGYGRLLVTSDQLEKIEEELKESNSGYSDLILSIIENGAELERVHLRKICLIAAHPVWGDTFTYEDKKNSTGLWELEVQDYRSIRLMSVLDNEGVNNNQLAVFNVKNKLGEWIDETINEDNPWTIKQLIEDKCFDPFDISIDPELPEEIKTTPENLFLSALPAPLVADLLLAHHSCKMAIRYDPTEDRYFRAYESIDNFAATIEHRKIFGGYSKLYPVGFPEKTMRYQRDIELVDDVKTAAKPTCKNFLKTTLASTNDRPAGTAGIGKVEEKTVVPIYDRNNSMTPADSSYSRRKFPQFHAVYHGFIQEALTSTAMIGLVRFDWMDQPFTEIHAGLQSPIRTVLEGPCAHYLRDTPLRLSIDGDLSLPPLGNDVYRFRLKAVYDDYLECKQLDGTTEVGSIVKVAKPYHLRRTPFHNKTINGITYTYTGVQSRTKTRDSPSETENQVIVPAYQEAVTGYGGDEIYACKPSGGTGVKIGWEDEDVIWLDINNAGRAWAKVTE